MANKKMQQVQTNTFDQEELAAIPIKARINSCRPVDADKGQNRNPWENETFRNKPCDLFDAAKPFLHILTERPMRSNPFSLIHRQKDIDAFVFALVRMTAWRADEYNSYWNAACGHLYHALVGYVYYQGIPEEQNLKTIFELLQETRYEEEGAADLLFQKLAESAPDDITVFYYHQYKAASHAAQKSVWISCVSLLRSFELYPAFDTSGSKGEAAFAVDGKGCVPCYTADDDDDDGDDDEMLTDWATDAKSLKHISSYFVTEDQIARSAQRVIDLIRRAHCVHPEKMPDTDLEALNVLSDLLTIESAGTFKEHFPEEAFDVESLVLDVLKNVADKATLMSNRIFSRRDIRVLKSLLLTLFPIRF